MRISTERERGLRHEGCKLKAPKSPLTLVSAEQQWSTQPTLGLRVPVMAEQQESSLQVFVVAVRPLSPGRLPQGDHANQARHDRHQTSPQVHALNATMPSL